MSQNPSFGKLSLASVLAHKHANPAPVSPRTPCIDCETHFLASDLVFGKCPECFREDVEEQARLEARQREEDKFDARERRLIENDDGEGFSGFSDEG